MDLSKGLYVDKIVMSSELWYLRDYKNDYPQFGYTFPSKSSGAPSNTVKEMFWTVPDGAIGVIEVQDGSTGEWFELTDALIFPKYATSYHTILNSVSEGNQVGIGAWRPGGAQPSWNINVRLRTFILPFTT